MNCNHTYGVDSNNDLVFTPNFEPGQDGFRFEFCPKCGRNLRTGFMAPDAYGIKVKARAADQKFIVATLAMKDAVESLQELIEAIL